MGIFDLPPVEKRKVSKMFFQYGYIGDEESFKEPAFYISYRVGHDMRYISFFSAVVLFPLCLSYRYLGFFPSMAAPVVQDDFLGIYLHYINYSGVVMAICLPYYFMLFKKHVRFSGNNILREKMQVYKNLPNGSKAVLPLMFIASLIFVVKPSAITSIFYMTIFQGLFIQFFDTTSFVFLMSTLIALVHSLFAALLFSFSTSFFYFYSERKK